VTNVVNKLNQDFTPTDTGPPTVVAGTGASATYMSTNCPVLHPQLATKSLEIQNPKWRNNEIHARTVGEIDLPMLRPAARRAYNVRT
jgi:hypothetical protein